MVISPRVFKVTVFPPVFGPVITSMSKPLFTAPSIYPSSELSALTFSGISGVPLFLFFLLSALLSLPGAAVPAAFKLSARPSGL